jgi:cardiolipin synthase
MGRARDEQPAERIRGTLGWAHWPFFVWKRVPPSEKAGPGPVPSILHTGYFFSALAFLLDGTFWLWFHCPFAPLFLLLHLLWISILTSLLLLNPRFLEYLDGRPLQRLGWANRLSVARVYLLPVLVDLIWLRLWLASLFGYVVLGLTDVADGIFARRLHEESKLGFVLDPFGDILFHLGILVSLVGVGILSGWTGTLVTLRYGLLLVGCGILYLSKGEIWIQPTPFGKATGLAISALTAFLFVVLGTGMGSAPAYRWADLALRVLFAATILHVLVIGWVNFRRPPQGGIAVYRRGWGLLVGHRKGTGPEDLG